MVPRMVGGCLFLMIFACAGANRNAVPADLAEGQHSPRLYVGHSQSGDVVIASSHYDAMTGLATTDSDLGLPARKDGDGAMLCTREVVTGSHFPHWICRYQDDVVAERERMRAELDAPRLSIGRASPGSSISVTLGRGGAPNR